jgi:hypothetical protein
MKCPKKLDIVGTAGKAKTGYLQAHFGEKL